MTEAITEANVEAVGAENQPLSATDAGKPIRSPSLRNFRGVRAEDMMGLLADAIDYEFLEIVLGCRGRKVPKDIGI